MSGTRKAAKTGEIDIENRAILPEKKQFQYICKLHL
jgi:hypothetical protein